jgi:hypothetical protein
MSPLSIKVEFRAEHGGSDECGYAERKRDNREGHGFDHERRSLLFCPETPGWWKEHAKISLRLM